MAELGMPGDNGQQAQMELLKARRWVGQHDQLVLKAWCLATFGHMYKDVIIEVFQTTMRT